jgi:hypothetical protein
MRFCVVGSLPTTAGWQPALPGILAQNAFCDWDRVVIPLLWPLQSAGINIG